MIDFRKLNELTISSFLLPNNRHFRSVRKRRIFLSLNLVSGYHQISMSKNTKIKLPALSRTDIMNLIECRVKKCDVSKIYERNISENTRFEMPRVLR